MSAAAAAAAAVLALTSFKGNPYKTITAVDTSGGVTCSRTSGQTPAFFQFSASAITATGTSNAYEDLEYSWSCGDGSGTESIYDPVIGRYVNPNTTQTGPEAFYVYRSPGTYTVTLTVRSKNGSVINSTQVTQDVTVTAYNASGGHWYFDWSAPGGGNGSQATPFNTVAQFNTKAAIANASLHINRGGHSQGTVGLNVSASPMRIDAYGSGADPIVEITSGTNNAFFMWNGSVGSPVSRDDVVVSGVKFVRGGNATGAPFIIVAGNAVGLISNVYLDNCNVLSISSAVAANPPNIVDVATVYGSANLGMWGGSVTAVGEVLGNSSIVWGAADWVSFVGLTINGRGESNVFDHHMYPDIQNHCLYRYLNFGDGPNRNYCINTNWQPVAASPAIEDAKYHCVSDCYLSGTLRGWDAGVSNAPDAARTRFQNFVVQNCNFTGLTGDGGGYGGVSCYSMTFRNSAFWGCDGGRFWAAGGTASATIYKIYGIRGYVTGSGSEMFDLANQTWTNPQTFRDVIIYDTRATARLVRLTSFADAVSAGSDIDYVQHYAPSDADGKVWYELATARSLAEVQAGGLNAHGLAGNPDWVNPANGDFRPRSVTMQLTCV